MNKIICLWSCPRNVSTALMYSFAQRKDTKVFDEALYAHYLKSSGVIHPGREDVLLSQENNGDKVVKNIILKKREFISFHKLMTHFLININTDFLSEVTNVIFIRNPKEIIFSYSKVIPNPKMEDIGVEQQYNLYLELERSGKTPIVLDSKYLLQNPELALKKLCSLLNIPFDNKMLKWESGSREEDGVWEKYWYKNVHNSTSFLEYTEKVITLENSNLELYEKCKPYYKFLTNKSIKI